LKYINLSGIQGIQNDISDIKIKFNTGITAVREDIGTLTKAHSQLNLLFQTHNTTTLEKIKFEKELQTLKEKHSNDLMKYGAVGVIGFGAGMLVDRFFPSLLDSFVTWIKEQIKNTNAGYTNTPIPQPGIIHPDIHYIYSGVNPGTNTSGTLCSGSFPTTYGEVHSTGFNTVPNQQEGVIQPDLHNEVNLVTNPSGSQCSGALYSSHAEIVPIQNVTPIQNSLPSLIPSYSYIPLTPPNDPSDSPLMQQLKKTKGKQCETYLGKFFIHQGYRVIQTQESHDYGADLILERAGEKTVVQVKQQKENVGLGAVQEVIGAKGFYHTPKALVITTSQFTKSALELAHTNGVECWDGKRLLEELYKHQFFYPPE
jgi:Restriction endonuclease